MEKGRGRRLIEFIGIAAAGLALAAATVLVVRPSLYRRLAGLITGTPPVSSLNVMPDRSKFPVRGIDVSHHNGDIDFMRVAADTIDFVYIKTTEGVDHTDPRYLANYESARKAGLLTGFYHFFRFDRGGVRQGRNFLTAIRGLESRLPLVIDFETGGNPEGLDYYLIVGRLRDLSSYLVRHGHRVMIYCNPKDYEHYIRGNFDDFDLWLATEREPGDGDPRKLWQHSHIGKIAGIDKAVDINTFNGTRDEFRQWLDIPAPIPVSEPQGLTPASPPVRRDSTDTIFTQ